MLFRPVLDIALMIGQKYTNTHLKLITILLLELYSFLNTLPVDAVIANPANGQLKLPLIGFVPDWQVHDNNNLKY
jgi:hypothetical protein